MRRAGRRRTRACCSRPTRDDLARLSAAQVAASGLAPRRASALVRVSQLLDLERLAAVPPEAAASRLLRERAARPLDGGDGLPARPRPLRPRARRRPRADQALQRAARPPRRGRGHGRAARAATASGPGLASLHLLRAAPARAAGTRAASANRICMNSVLVPPAGVLDGELREPLLRFVQAAFALAARDLANGAEVPFVLDAHEGRESSLYSYRPLYGAFLDERRALILALPDARRALALLEATPGAVEYARLHVGDARRRSRGAARGRDVAAARADRRARGRLRVPRRGLRRDLRAARPRRRRQPPPLRRAWRRSSACS